MKALTKMLAITFFCRSIAYTTVIFQQENGNDYISNLPFLFFYLLEAIFLWFIYKKNYKDDDYLDLNRKTLGWTVFIIISFLYIIAEENLISILFSDFVQDFPIKLDFFSIISISFFSCISEEIIFRGVILNRLKCKHTFIISNIIQAFIFGILHVELPVVLSSFIFGLFSGYILHRSNLIYCILIHCISNFISSLESKYGFNLTFSSLYAQLSATITCSILIIIIIIGDCKMRRIKNR